MRTKSSKSEPLTFLMVFALFMTGCAYQQLPPETRETYQYQPVPRVIVTPLPAAPKRRTLSAVAKALGLAVSIDMKHGYRVLSGHGHKVTIMPGRREAVVNGSSTRIDEPVMWQAGVLVAHEELQGTLQKALAAYPVVKKAPVVVVKNVSHTKKDAPKGAYNGRLPSIPSEWNFPANRRWTSIVIHHSATSVGGAKSFHRAHAKKWKNGLGYHFVVGNGSDTSVGAVEIGRRWTLQNKGIHGAHAGIMKYNRNGIGICLVGNFQGKRPTDRQLAALTRLVQLLMKRYKIPKSRVLGHKHARPGHTDCPGKRFPWKRFNASL
jgi:N-acetylmuramoyl-L-alanine amidase